MKMNSVPCKTCRWKHGRGMIINNNGYGLYPRCFVCTVWSVDDEIYYWWRGK